MENKNKIIAVVCIIVAALSFFALLYIIKYYLIQDYGAKLQAVVQYSAIRFPPKFRSDFKFDGCWTAEVRNKGSVSFRGVKLRLPYLEISMIERENFEPVISDSKYVVPIDDLAPLEEVMIYGWTSGYKGPRFKDKSMIRLTYDKGIGRVILKLPLGHYWYYFSKLWPLIFFLWTIIIVCAIWLYFYIKHKESDEWPGLENRRPHLM